MRGPDFRFRTPLAKLDSETQDSTYDNRDMDHDARDSHLHLGWVPAGPPYSRPKGIGKRGPIAPPRLSPVKCQKKGKGPPDSCYGRPLSVSFHHRRESAPGLGLSDDVQVREHDDLDAPVQPTAIGGLVQCHRMVFPIPGSREIVCGHAPVHQEFHHR